MNRTRPQNWHRDRDDHFAPRIDAYHAALLPVQGMSDFLVALAVLGSEFLVERKVSAIEPGADRDQRTLRKAGLFRWRRQLEAEHVLQCPAVKQQPAVGVVDACARLGRRDQGAE